MTDTSDFWNNVVSFFDAESGMSARDRTARELLANTEALSFMAEEPEMLAAVFSGMVAVDLVTQRLVFDDSVEGIAALKDVMSDNREVRSGVAVCLAAAPKLERLAYVMASRDGSGTDISYELYRPQTRRSP